MTPVTTALRELPLYQVWSQKYYRLNILFVNVCTFAEGFLWPDFGSNTLVSDCVDGTLLCECVVLTIYVERDYDVRNFGKIINAT